MFINSLGRYIITASSHYNNYIRPESVSVELAGIASEFLAYATQSGYEL